jgi:hypothetical protein
MRVVLCQTKNGLSALTASEMKRFDLDQELFVQRALPLLSEWPGVDDLLCPVRLRQEWITPR